MAQGFQIPRWKLELQRHGVISHQCSQFSSGWVDQSNLVGTFVVCGQMRTGDNGARLEEHMQIEGWLMLWCRMRMHTNMHTRTYAHAHIQEGHGRQAGVLSQQSELLPSDDTACEDDVGESGQSGASMICKTQTARWEVRVASPPALLPLEVAETGFPQPPTRLAASCPARRRRLCLLAVWMVTQKHTQSSLLCANHFSPSDG